MILVSDEVKDIPLNTKAEIAKAVFDEIENKI